MSNGPSAAPPDAAAGGAPAPTSHASFAAFQHRGFRFYFLGTATAMMADNIEHVITYWVMFQKFHSPELAFIAVVSHWVPFFLFSGYVGALADRIDPRRLIQLGMLIFMAVSISWGLLIQADALRPWHAWLLLSAHGIAGVLWTPSAQLLIHDIVDKKELPSAIRLGATARYVGTLMGPAIGNVLLLLLGAAHGIYINALIYLPMFIWLIRAPYGPRFRHGAPAPRAAVRGLGDAWATLRNMRDNRILLGMTLLSGAASFFIGTAYQALMPDFANDLRHGDPGLAYFALAAADACGALVGAVLLESRGLLQPRPNTALLLGMLWCCALTLFSLTHTYAVSVVALFCAGFFELAFGAMATALVQMHAPAALRGHIIGVYVMASLGLRFVSGFTVALLGAAIGIHFSLAASAIALFVVIVALQRWMRGGGTRLDPAPAA